MRRLLIAILLFIPTQVVAWPVITTWDQGGATWDATGEFWDPSMTPIPTFTPPAGSPTPTVTATLTPVPTPVSGQCAGPVPCTETGELTNWLQLCKPGAGDVNWHMGLNGNVELLDSFFPGCVLAPQRGGTGFAGTPEVGSLLVGSSGSTYAELEPGATGKVLVSAEAEALGVAWKWPAETLYYDEPATAECDSDDERGKLAISTHLLRLYICNGATRGWDYITLQ